MLNMLNTVVDEGVIKFDDTDSVPAIFRGKTYIYRRTLSQPITKGSLYYLPGDKPEWMCAMELDLMLDDKKIDIAMLESENVVNGDARHELSDFYIFWNEDGTPDISCGQIDIYGAVMTNNATFVRVNNEFEELHETHYLYYQFLISYLINQ